MRRRDFIKVAAGSVAIAPLTAWAQQPAGMRRVGVLMTALESDSEYQTYISTLRKELQNLGWTEGGNLRIDYRWGGLNVESRGQFAKELIAMQPDVIFSQNTPTTITPHQQTQTVPIVFVLVSDPIGSGFVKSFPSPGGNITGFIAMEATVSGKWLGLLKEIDPNITRVIFLLNPTTAPYFELYLNPLKAAAQSFGVEVVEAPVHACVRTRDRRCRKGRAEYWPYCDVGCFPERSPRGGHIVGSTLPSPCHLSVSLLLRLGRSDVLRTRYGRSIPARSFVR